MACQNRWPSQNLVSRAFAGGANSQIDERRGRCIAIDVAGQAIERPAPADAAHFMYVEDRCFTSNTTERRHLIRVLNFPVFGSSTNQSDSERIRIQHYVNLQHTTYFSS
jgi:hypothetical protein